jgi:hypothetical protein
VEGPRHGINHNAAAALTGDLNLKIEGRRLAECFERQQPVRAVRLHGPCSVSKRG